MQPLLSSSHFVHHHVKTLLHWPLVLPPSYGRAATTAVPSTCYKPHTQARSRAVATMFTMRELDLDLLPQNKACSGGTGSGMIHVVNNMCWEPKLLLPPPCAQRNVMEASVKSFSKVKVYYIHCSLISHSHGLSACSYACYLTFVF